MAQQTVKEIEDAIRAADASPQAQALRDHVNFAIRAYVAFLNKYAPGFHIHVAIGNPRAADEANITVFHPFEFRGGH